MNERKMMVARVSLLAVGLALLGVAPLACDVSTDEESSDADQVIECDPTPAHCLDEGCVGFWREQCVVAGDVCVPVPELGNDDPSKCFRGECHCQAGCYWDGAQCILDTGCPAVPPPTEPTEPYPSEGCDVCPHPNWNPEDGLTLKWSEPAEQYLQYETAVRRNPYLHRKCTLEPDWVSERLAFTTYDIYFGMEADPPLLQAAVPTSRHEQPGHVTVSGEPWGGLFQHAAFHVAGPLAQDTWYFWRVVVHNQSGQTASSPIWQFKTVGPAVATTCPGMPTVQDQDGNSYDTALIGEQCWMKTPLRLGEIRQGYYTCQQDNDIVEKSCQTTTPDCIGYYTWNELMSYDAPGSICPAGWRVPSVADWYLLFNHPDAGRLSPSYGGYIEYDNLSGGEGATAYIWTSTQQTSGLEGTARVAVIAHPSKGLAPEITTINKGYRMTAYCLRD